MQTEAPMFVIYVNTEEVYRTSTWARIKSFLIACGTSHAFVERPDTREQWNVTVRNGRLNKHTA
jgi:hypothetical protein